MIEDAHLHRKKIGVPSRYLIFSHDKELIQTRVGNNTSSSRRLGLFQKAIFGIALFVAASSVAAQDEWTTQRLAKINWLCMGVKYVAPVSLLEVTAEDLFRFAPLHPPVPHEISAERDGYRECMDWLGGKSRKGVGRTVSNVFAAERAFASFTGTLQPDPRHHFFAKAWIPKRAGAGGGPVNCNEWFESIGRSVVLATEQCKKVQAAVTAYVTFLGLAVNITHVYGVVPRKYRRCGHRNRPAVEAVLTAAVSFGQAAQSLRRKNVVEFVVDELRWMDIFPEDRRTRMADVLRVASHSVFDAKVLAHVVGDTESNRRFALLEKAYLEAEASIERAIAERKYSRYSPNHKTAERAFFRAPVVTGNVLQYVLGITDTTAKRALACLGGSG